MHPTRRLLMDTVYELMKSQSPEKITGQMVLQRSGVSHGSLYHHFEDASDLIETVLVESFFGRASEDIVLLRSAVEETTNRDIYLLSISAISRDVHQPEKRTNRMQRVNLLSYASSRPRLLKRLAEEQTALSLRFADVVIIAKDKGWVSDDIDPLGAAVFFQALTLGRIIDDVSSEHVAPDSWNHIVMKCIENVFGN